MVVFGVTGEASHDIIDSLQTKWDGTTENYCGL